MKYLFLACLLAGCVLKPHVQPGPIPTCNQVCQHFDDLKCNDVLNTANDSSCMSVCANLTGTVSAGLLNCYLASTSCAQVDTCDTQ
jgi:hypothetical protein